MVVLAEDFDRVLEMIEVEGRLGAPAAPEPGHWTMVIIMIIYGDYHDLRQ